MMSGVAYDTLDGILADASRVFCYDRDSRYQERAHDYLHERGVPRTPRDTACEAVVTDLCRRAYAAGALEDTSSRVAEALSGIAADLVDASHHGANDVQSFQREDFVWNGDPWKGQQARG